MSGDLPRDPRDVLSQIHKKTSEAQRRTLDADTRKITETLGIENRSWQRNLRLLMRLSSFSYGVVGLSLCAGLGFLALKRRVDDGSK